MHLCFWWYVTKLLSLLSLALDFFVLAITPTKRCLFQLGFSNLDFVKLLFWDLQLPFSICICTIYGTEAHIL
jgi:hypothetical protein